MSDDREHCVTTADVVREIARAGIECHCHADESAVLAEPVSTDRFDGSQLTLYTGTEPTVIAEYTDNSRGLILAPLELKGKLGAGPYAFVDDVQLAFVLAAHLFVPKFSGELIHPSAVIDPRASIGKDVIVGANSVIGSAQVGDNTRIGALVSIGDHVKIGNSVTILNGAHLGDPGMGSVTDKRGNQILFPHFEEVIVEDGAVLGTSTVVHRGSLKPTIIGRNSILCTACFVAHNCRVGAHVFMSPHTIMGGSTIVGDKCVLGMGCCLRDRIELAEEITVGMNSTVTKSFSSKGCTLMGSPAVVVGGHP